jgi:hypothetical protein
MKDQDPLIVSTEVSKEQHTARFVFLGGSWPDGIRGDTARGAEFRDRWKQVEFFHAAEWLRGRPPSAPDRLGQEEVESYLVVEGYFGIIPQELLKEIVRLGCELEVHDSSSP